MKPRISHQIQMISIPLICSLVVLPNGLAQNVSSGEDKMSASSLMSRADSLFERRQYDQAREVYLLAADSAAASGDNCSLTEAYAMIARTYLTTDKKDEGRPWIEKARERARNNEPLGWSRYLGVRGRFEWQDKELEKATATFKEMYQYCSEKGLHERAIDAAHMVAITGGHEDQVEWGLKGIKEAEAGNITSWLGPLWNNLGFTYEDMGKYRESLDAYLKAREYHHKYSDEKSKIVADWAVGHAYRLLGESDSAAQWITQDMLARFESLGDAEFQGWTLKEMGEIAMLKSKPDSALALFIRAEGKLRAADMANWDPEGYKKLQEQIEKLR